MAEKSIELEMSVILPDFTDDQDDCLDQLESVFQGRRGIHRAHIKRDQTPATLCIHYDPNLTSLAYVRRAAEESGSMFTDRYRHEYIPFTGMGNADTAIRLGEVLENISGMLHASVNYAAGLAFVAYDSTVLNRVKIDQVLREYGARPIPINDIIPNFIADDDRDHERDHDQHLSGAPAFLPHLIQEKWTLLLLVLAGLFLLVGWLGESVLGFSRPLFLAFFLLSYLAGGYDVAIHAIPGLLKGKFDTDVLMLAAALGAAFLGEWAEGAFLLFLFSLGHAGEHYALDRARNAVNELGVFMPKTGYVRREGRVLEVPISKIDVGEVVLVRPGDRIPVDGEVLLGEGLVDQSTITGESYPISKKPGDKVFAGTINEDTALEVRVARLAKDNTLARVMRMVAEAQSQQSPTQRFTEGFTRYFVPAVLIGVLVVVFLPPLMGWMPFRDSFYRGMLLLVAASPCALALGTPAAILAGIAQAARNGVLIKGGVHLENLGRIRAIGFDKTGTLTHGKFKLTDIVPINGQNTDELLMVAASVEQGFSHPIALAVLDAANRRGLSLANDTVGFENVAGLGVRCRIQGQLTRIGSVKFIHNHPEKTVDCAVGPIVKNLEADHKTTMVVSQDGECLGVMGFADTPRSGIREILAHLRNIGVSIFVMLTGDNRNVAAKIADEIGIIEFEAELLPEDKLAKIQQMKEKYGAVAMVGDGVNDAPALATATVGIAMGGAGTSVALETADIVLMADNLGKLPFAVGLSRASLAIIRQNLAIALSVIALLIITSVLGLLELNWAVVLHEGSTVIVVLNALRLLGFRSN